jgi:hypothetical protein
MSTFLDDPIHNAIHSGIKEDIAVAFSHERFRAGIILVYAGMDAMAYLDMPGGQAEVTGRDFSRWAETYVRFPCREQLTGADLYGARCSMLHAYGVVSKMSRAGKCRMVGYCDYSIPEVSYDPAIQPDLVIISAHGLKDAFFQGIDRFLVAAFTDKAKAPIVEQRLAGFTMQLPFGRKTD